MRAWEPCTFSMLASVLQPARSFVPAASFRGAPLSSRNLRRPLYSHAFYRTGINSSASITDGGSAPRGLRHRRALLVLKSGGSSDATKRVGGVPLTCLSSYSGAVEEAQVDARVGKDWSVSKVLDMRFGNPSR